MADYLWVGIAGENPNASDIMAVSPLFAYYRNVDTNALYYAGKSMHIKVATYVDGVGRGFVAGTNIINNGVVLASGSITNFTTSQQSGLYINIRPGYNQSAYTFPVLSDYPDLVTFNSQSAAIAAINDGNWSGPTVLYSITYHYTNSTVSGPSEAAIGDTVTVSAVPDNNYGITDAASQILVTNNDVAVPYQWNPSTNIITFTMPDPS